MRTPTTLPNLAPWLQSQADILSTLERLGEPTEAIDAAAIVNEAERVAARFGIAVDDERALTTAREGLAAIGRLIAAVDAPAEVLTVAEAARLLRVKGDTVRGWIAAGRLKASNTGNGHQRPRYRITRPDLDTFLAGRTRPTPATTRKRRRPSGVFQFFPER